MRREFVAIQALARVGFPVPRAIAYTDDASVVGAPCYLMEFVEGHVLHTLDDVRTLTSSAATACSLELVDTLARLHAVDLAEAGLSSFGRPGGFLQRRITSWLRQWRTVEHRDLPAVEALGERLLARLPADGGTALVHGDYRLGNVLFALGPAPRLTAVLDWEMSTLGDPLTDLAHLLVYWEPTRGRLTHPSQLVAKHPGFLDGARVAERYSALTHRDVSALPFYLAFEHWRAAIIKDAIYLRAVARPESAIPDDTVALGESVQRHLEEAADLLADIAADGARIKDWSS
jgi:aminoglycoside phosphotransferase (APT) family kinase protein